MLRHFQITQTVPAYVGGFSTVTFRQRAARADARCAIIGIAGKAGTFDILSRNLVTAFRVAGRESVKQDPVPLACLQPLAPFTGTVPPSGGNPYFPGNALPLPGGGRCGGVWFNGKEDVQVTLNDFVGANPIATLVMYCVEFPLDCNSAKEQEAVDRLWERFRAGVGQCHFVGTQVTYLAAATLSFTLQANQNPPHQLPCRRTMLRGVSRNALGLIEARFIDTTLIARTSVDQPQEDIATPARLIAGTPNLDFAGATAVDLNLFDFSLVDAAAPAPGLDTTLTIVHCFEGRDPAAPMLKAQQVF